MVETLMDATALGFWTGMAFALPCYWGLDHLLIPYLVDHLRTAGAHLRTSRARFRGR